MNRPKPFLFCTVLSCMWAKVSCGFSIIRGSVWKWARKLGSEECQRTCFVLLDFYLFIYLTNTLQPYIALCSLCVCLCNYAQSLCGSPIGWPCCHTVPLCNQTRCVLAAYIILHTGQSCDRVRSFSLFLSWWVWAADLLPWLIHRSSVFFYGQCSQGSRVMREPVQNMMHCLHVTARYSTIIVV